MRPAKREVFFDRVWKIGRRPITNLNPAMECQRLGGAIDDKKILIVDDDEPILSGESVKPMMYS